MSNNAINSLIIHVANGAVGIGSPDTHACEHCGTVYDDPIITVGNTAGCLHEDCPGHDLDNGWVPTHLEAMQYAAEDELHRTRGRYMRGARLTRQ